MEKNNNKPESMKSSDSPNTSEEQSGTLHIETIIAGGDGMARRSDGCVVFVPRTAPGDRVEVETIEIHKQWQRGRIKRIVKKGPDRVEPPCPYYEICGGCQIQHLDYQRAQLPVKAATISDALRRIGKIEIEPPEVTGSDLEFGYRNRVSFVVRNQQAGIEAGFHNLYDPSVIVDVERCLLAEEPLNEVWAALRATWNRSKDHLPQGDDLRFTLRTNSENAVGLAIEGVRVSWQADKLLEISDRLLAVWLVNQRGDIIGGAGAQTLDELAGPHIIPVAGTGFIQVNRGAAERLDAYVHRQCGDVDGKRIVDAYCGFGLRSLALAQDGAKATGIERDRHAVKTAKRLAKRMDVPARFMAGDVEQVLPQVLPADTIILNPPRRGVGRRVIDNLLKSKITRIIYVSCNPATLARDLQRLSSRFTLNALHAFDLFPQTAHIETVATLERIEGSNRGRQ